jgi:hypothetical protein
LTPWWGARTSPTQKAVARNPTAPGGGYDALKDRFVDMFEAGIVDPAKVTRSACRNAATVAAIVLTAEATATEVPERRGESLPPMPEMWSAVEPRPERCVDVRLVAATFRLVPLSSSSFTRRSIRRNARTPAS